MYSLKLIRAIALGVLIGGLIGIAALCVNGRYAEAALTAFCSVIAALVVVGISADIQEMT